MSAQPKASSLLDSYASASTMSRNSMKSMNGMSQMSGSLSQEQMSQMSRTADQQKAVVVKSDSCSSKRAAGEAVVAFVVSFAVLWAIGYLLFPDKFKKELSVSSSGISLHSMWKSLGVIALISLIIAVIYGFIRHKSLCG